MKAIANQHSSLRSSAFTGRWRTAALICSGITPGSCAEAVIHAVEGGSSPTLASKTRWGPSADEERFLASPSPRVR